MDLDSLILKYIGVKTPRQIAEMVGVDPKVVLARKDELLNEIDVLTLDQKRAKLIVELQEIARNAMEKAKNIPDEFYAGTLNAAVNAQREVLRQLEVQEKRDTDAVMQLNQLRIRELLRLMDAVLGSGVAVIATRFNLDQEELMEVFYELMEVESERLEIL